MTNTRPTTSTLDHDDPRSVFARAVGSGGRVVAAVRADQLTDPTPCSEMDVRTMLGHLVGVLDRVATLGRGGDPFGVEERTPDDDDWLDAWTSAAHGVQAAWNDDAVLERPMALPWIQGSGRDVLLSYVSELVVHTWDLATAVGYRAEWDDDVIEAALAQASLLPAENRYELFVQVSEAMGLDEVAVPFAEAVPVPGDAPGIDRLVAWNGRDPALARRTSR